MQVCNVFAVMPPAATHNSHHTTTTAHNQIISCRILLRPHHISPISYPLSPHRNAASVLVSLPTGCRTLCS